GLLKVLGALRAGVRPATPGIDRPAAGLGRAPLRLLQAAEPWDASGPRRAAVSAFGFGGNDAHVIVEEPPAARRAGARSPGATPALRPMAPRPTPIAVVAIGARVGDGASAADFAAALFSGDGAGRRAERVTLSLAGLRFPPRDLEE